MPRFNDAEIYFRSLFIVGESVNFENQSWQITKVGKPVVSRGEPKTDIYILLENNTSKKEIKISYKKSNADFLENKIKAERAEQIFGENWQDIIRQSTEQIKSKFADRPLIYKNGFGRVLKGAITIGWKFELVNKPNGHLSYSMALTQEQLWDIYTGHNLPFDKKHAMVNGELIQDSGVANYILLGQAYCTVSDVLNGLIGMQDYIDANPAIYFACKALNYRTFQHKYDGNRPLAVQVSWQVVDDRLSPTLIFDRPLGWNGNDTVQQLKNCLNELDIQTTDDINETNADMSCVYL